MEGLSCFAVRRLENGRWEIVGRDHDNPHEPPFRVFGYIDEERKLRLSQSQKRTRDCSTVSASKS